MNPRSFKSNPNLRSQKQRSQSRHGTVAVEFAISVSVLFLLFFGTVEFVRIGMVRHAVDNASYEAARRVIVPGANVAEAEAVAQNVMRRIGVTNATVTVSPNPILESTTEVSVEVVVPMQGNGWGTTVFGKNLEIESTTGLFTERPPLISAKALPPAPSPSPGPKPKPKPVPPPTTPPGPPSTTLPAPSPVAPTPTPPKPPTPAR